MHVNRYRHTLYVARPATANKRLPFVDLRGSLPVVEQQIVEIEKQNCVINSLERQMLRLKAMYETAVEQRNFAGVQLIDRNDELCVLYEKSNIQETTLTVNNLCACFFFCCIYPLSLARAIFSLDACYRARALQQARFFYRILK